jgi:hypothetical protein
MLTLAVAEVVGIVYYRALADGAGSAALASSLRRIAGEESRHLDFQAAFFERCVALEPAPLRAPYRWLLRGLLLAIFLAALTVLLLDHGALLRRTGTRRRSLAQLAWRELQGRRFLATPLEPERARALALIDRARP